jgi:hypothetical protein
MKTGVAISYNLSLKVAKMMKAHGAVLSGIATHAQKETDRRHQEQDALMARRRLEGKTG